MAISEKRNANLMNLIKRMHGVVENADIEKHRQSQNHFGALLGNSKDVLIEDVSIRDHPSAGEILQGEWVYVNRAHMKKYVILYCHGGGYSTGSRVYARTLTTKLAMSTSMDVLSFDYRLAPEHPYPAATEDAMKVWNYLMLLGYGARDVILAGDSAGGNLALSLALQLKAQKRLLPRGLILMSPWTDLTASGQSHETKAAIDPVLNAGYLAEMTGNYAAKEKLNDPFISPLFGDYEGFPPVYIQVGENEVLLDDSVMLYRKLLHANVSVRLDRFPGMWHVFQMSPFKTAYEAMDKNAEFIYDICR
ncbi:MAG: alpha/beta hydrolase [Lachnospiraceae bacterium]|jgi:monoterpene epsilon-lactone hydrolase|nr:alpha/beta hydrolase [Lachnospiraceae bacterium]MCI8987126.1 alpha/beta hydrolase [Lachnospiraceae bacterium]MCI9013662.1 alpha/beta hydrolase [Lachnospiraceae bacterium]MCI9254021.1 alpha/beta hydrolase [Lachnospiraceae bacterium]